MLYSSQLITCERRIPLCLCFLKKKSFAKKLGEEFKEHLVQDLAKNFKNLTIIKKKNSIIVINNKTGEEVEIKIK